MEWESPWGVGFPGWHIECSAMSMVALGPTLDIHTGGIDHINIHHTNEIAQSEAATGKTFVDYWVHHAFLMVDGQKMSKSIGNIYTVEDIVSRGYDPMALRYLYLQTHYRQEMNFTFAALDAAQTAYQRLLREIASWEEPKGKGRLTDYENEFKEAVNDDLNMPKALAVMWEMVKSENPSYAKHESLLWMDSVLGIELHLAKEKSLQKKEDIPESVMALVKQREQLRNNKRYHLADEIRSEIQKMGYDVLDEDGKTVVHKL